MRNYRGYDWNSGYPITELTFEDFFKIFSPYVEHFEHYNFNGNLGDFGLAKDGVEIVAYLTQHQRRVSINTNGSMRDPTWWARLASPMVSVGFALDGLADTHSMYRQDTDWHRIIANAQALIQAGGRAVWRFAPFDHNRHQEQACRDLSVELGFERFENIYDGRDTGPVFSRDGQFVRWLGKDSGENPEIKILLDGHRAWARDPQLSSQSQQSEIKCYHLRSKEIYVAADGRVYPCCYLGFYPDTMEHAGNRQLRQLVHDNNALEVGLEQAVSWFNDLERNWAGPRSQRLYTCLSTCGSQLDHTLSQ